MSLGLLLKLVHIFTAFWFVGGVLGRGYALARARQATDVKQLDAIMQIVDLLDKRAVIPGSTAVLVAGIAIALASNWPVLGFLQGGTVNWVLASLLLFISNIPLVIFVYNPRGKTFGNALQVALAQNRITPELTSTVVPPHDSSTAALIDWYRAHRGG